MLEQPPRKFAEERLIFLRQRSLIRPCAKADLVLTRKRVSGKAMPDARKLQPMQKKSDFGSGTRTNLRYRAKPLLSAG